MQRTKRFLEWELSYSDCADEGGENTYPATVPGIVQMDMQRALDMPDFRVGDHEAEYDWMADKFWHYTARVDLTDVSGEGTVALVFTSVDYACDVKLNGETVLHHEGMFSAFEVDLTAYKGRVCALTVVVYPAPKRPGYPITRGIGGEASASCKPAFSYSWDWCPRFITLGICGEAYVEVRPAAYVAEVQASYVLNEDYTQATVSVAYQAVGAGQVHCRLLLPDGSCGAQTTASAAAGKATITLENPPLWYPVDHGQQPVCRLEVTLGDDTVSRPMGFRRAQLVSNPGWCGGSGPLTCDVAPMTAQINGNRYFLKGSNWVPPEMSPAMIEEGRLPKILTLVKELGMNVLRLWGGGYLMPEEFYDLCDAYGILVWQEFPLACACYSEEDSYLTVLEQEARTMLQKLRNHPCLLLWCGGNELFNGWSQMTNQSPALRLLDKLCYEEDRFTPYIMTSPQYGTAHGSYDMRLFNTGREHLSAVCESDFTAYTEFGVGAPSDEDYLRTFMTEEEVLDPKPGGIWEKRHAFFSCGTPERWFNRGAIRDLTGCDDEPLALFAAGNELQGRMYAAMFEECRRKWPRSSMALNWCLNEPWPTAAGNGLINYPARPRVSYAHVQNALRHQKLSLRTVKLSWQKHEEASVQAWLLNDQYRTFGACTATVTLSWEGGERVLGTWNFDPVQENQNQKGGTFTFPLPLAEECQVTITCPEYPEWNDTLKLYITGNKKQISSMSAAL